MNYCVLFKKKKKKRGGVGRGKMLPPLLLRAGGGGKGNIANWFSAHVVEVRLGCSVSTNVRHPATVLAELL